jgi:hypothetical protein
MSVQVGNHKPADAQMDKAEQAILLLLSENLCASHLYGPGAIIPPVSRTEPQPHPKVNVDAVALPACGRRPPTSDSAGRFATASRALVPSAVRIQCFQQHAFSGAHRLNTEEGSGHAPRYSICMRRHLLRSTRKRGRCMLDVKERVGNLQSVMKVGASCRNSSCPTDGQGLPI